MASASLRLDFCKEGVTFSQGQRAATRVRPLPPVSRLSYPHLQFVQPDLGVSCHHSDLLMLCLTAVSAGTQIIISLQLSSPAPRSSSWVSLSRGDSSYSLCMSFWIWYSTLHQFAVARARMTIRRLPQLGLLQEGPVHKGSPTKSSTMASSSPGTYPPLPHPHSSTVCLRTILKPPRVSIEKFQGLLPGRKGLVASKLCTP